MFIMPGVIHEENLRVEDEQWGETGYGWHYDLTVLATSRMIVVTGGGHAAWCPRRNLASRSDITYRARARGLTHRAG
jgi:hypothetical protein